MNNYNYKQIVKIAELDGFSDIQFHRDYDGSLYVDGVFGDNSNYVRSGVPNYFKKISAIRRVISNLPYEDQIEWTYELGRSLGFDNRTDWTYIDMLLSPPEKWCEALLKMKGLAV